jgi:hypothetical protein
VQVDFEAESFKLVNETGSQEGVGGARFAWKDGTHIRWYTDEVDSVGDFHVDIV